MSEPVNASAEAAEAEVANDAVESGAVAPSGGADEPETTPAASEAESASELTAAELPEIESEPVAAAQAEPGPSDALEASPVEPAVSEPGTSENVGSASPESADAQPRDAKPAVTVPVATSMEQGKTEPPVADPAVAQSDETGAESVPEGVPAPDAVDETGFAYATGDIVPGTVTTVSDESVEVDLGDDNRGIIPKGDLPATMPEVGAVIEGSVLRRDAEGRYVLSARKAQKERTWARLQHALETGETVFGVVKESTKGGLIVDIGARAFLPESLIDVRRPQDSKQFVGREVEVQVIELQRKGEKVVVNRRSVMEAYRAANREQLLAELAPGQVRVGVVTTIAPFGAFVDLGGVEGLIHISELAHRTVQDASEVVQVGQEVEVLVKDVQFARNKVSLSRKALLADPWEAFGQSHQAGDLVYGTVTGLAPFGAFVNVEVEGIEGIEGLIHVSELARQRVEHPSDVVGEGEGLWSKILSIDAGRRRLSLSLRRISD